MQGEVAAPREPADDEWVAAAIERVSEAGFPGRFEVERDRVWCRACLSWISTNDVRWRILEVVTVPDGPVLVGGIACPICHSRGTAITRLRVTPPAPKAIGRQPMAGADGRG